MEYFTITDLKQRGWTKSLISELNLKPDLEKTNPKFPTATPMKLYRTQKIYDLERTEQFQAVTADKEEVSISPELLEYVQNVELEFDDIPYELTHLALDSYNTWLLNSASVISGRKPLIEVGVEADTDFLYRIKGNYIRHHLSNYENILGFVQAHDCGFEEFGELKKLLNLHSAKKKRQLSTILLTQLNHLSMI
jgi:hypothetical protein